MSTVTNKQNQNDAPDEPTNCGTCKQPVITDDPNGGIQCDICNFWFHATSCQKMSQLRYSALNEEHDDNSLHWYCDRCRVSAKKMLTSLTTISHDIDLLKVDVAQLKTSQDDTNAAATLTRTDVATNRNDIKGLAADIVRLDKKLDHVSTEAQEIDIRKANIVIRGLPESNTTDDATLVKKVLTTLGFNNNDTTPADVITPTTITRIGKVDITHDNPRALRVILQTTAQRDKILDVSSSLKNVNSEGLPFDPNRVFISKDLTILQRQQAYEKRRHRRYNTRIQVLEQQATPGIPPGGAANPQ